MKNPKFQIFKGEEDHFYFRLIAANGEIILGSEGYITRTGCQNGISSVKENAPHDERYQKKTSEEGQFYFVLTAPNYEVIGKSEMYTTPQACDNGIEAVKSDAPDAPIEDTSG